jgi:hypothetical protein
MLYDELNFLEVEEVILPVSVDPILLGLDRQIQARGGDLAIPLEQFWIY